MKTRPAWATVGECFKGNRTKQTERILHVFHIAKSVSQRGGVRCLSLLIRVYQANRTQPSTLINGHEWHHFVYLLQLLRGQDSPNTRQRERHGRQQKLALYPLVSKRPTPPNGPNSRSVTTYSCTFSSCWKPAGHPLQPAFGFETPKHKKLQLPLL